MYAKGLCVHVSRQTELWLGDTVLMHSRPTDNACAHKKRSLFFSFDVLMVKSECSGTWDHFGQQDLQVGTLLVGRDNSGISHDADFTEKDCMACQHCWLQKKGKICAGAESWNAESLWWARSGLQYWAPCTSHVYTRMIFQVLSLTRPAGHLVRHLPKAEPLHASYLWLHVSHQMFHVHILWPTNRLEGHVFCGAAVGTCWNWAMSDALAAPVPWTSALVSHCARCRRNVTVPASWCHTALCWRSVEHHSSPACHTLGS